ncbi:hypothetical protein [Methyloceanibacter caenitepidi]|uniref:Uncharacterized protein n=1 Tax=Methyloceanibacter caenitepidi TaxID=1384459 RepID=A0A0A8K1Y2_9HYPH|nr:hypothetical protein [Methyloceanibacter caenitepidi]BAQ16895.1 hypothetical protein GL4_1439 [Methyloceanibacter caenitepidi]
MSESTQQFVRAKVDEFRRSVEAKRKDERMEFILQELVVQLMYLNGEAGDIVGNLDLIAEKG